jgi:phospholipid transport system substrate-binding protein
MHTEDISKFWNIKDRRPEAQLRGSFEPTQPRRRQPRLLFRLLVTAAVVWMFVLPTKARPATGSSNAPKAVVKAALDEALAVLRDHKTPLISRRQKLHELALEHLDFGDMARSALGDHWNELSPAQRNKFVPLFTAFMEDSYLDKIQDYSDLQVQYVRQSFNGPNDAEVDTQVKQKGNAEPIRVNFFLRREGDQWKVYDVAIESIRLVANYRNQFDRVISDEGGFDALMARLTQKQRQLDALLGK